jgi:hypothetical protein
MQACEQCQRRSNLAAMNSALGPTFFPSSWLSNEFKVFKTSFNPTRLVLRIVIVSFTLLHMGTPSVLAQTYKEDFVLTPSDLGITKYALSASPPSDKVMVFRQKKTLDGKDEEIFETISFTNGQKKTEKILLFRPTLFPFSTPAMQKQPVSLKTQDGGFLIPEGFWLKRFSMGDDGIQFHCVNDKGNAIDYLFRVEIENLSDVMKRIPELASHSTTEGSEWTYNAVIKEPK